MQGDDTNPLRSEKPLDVWLWNFYQMSSSMGSTKSEKNLHSLSGLYITDHNLEKNNFCDATFKRAFKKFIIVDVKNLRLSNLINRAQIQIFRAQMWIVSLLWRHNDSFVAMLNFFKATICLHPSFKLEVSSLTYVTSLFGLTMKLMKLIQTIDTSREEFFAVLALINLYFDSFVLFIIHTMPCFTMSFQVFACHHLFAN